MLPTNLQIQKYNEIPVLIFYYFNKKSNIRIYNSLLSYTNSKYHIISIVKKLINNN